MGINDEKDKALMKRASSLLDDAAENLDEKTLASLRQIRRKALDSATQSTGVNWMLPAGGFAAIATVAIVSVSIWTANPIEDELTHAFSDIELLTSSESLEFYEELEFYAWIDEQDAKG